MESSAEAILSRARQLGSQYEMDWRRPLDRQLLVTLVMGEIDSPEPMLALTAH